MDDIEQAYEDGLVDSYFISLDDVKRDLPAGKDQVLARLGAEHYRRLVEDTVKEMGWWGCFQKDPPSKSKSTVETSAKSGPKPPTVSQPKVGRNDAHAEAERNSRSAVVHDGQFRLWRPR